MNRRAISRTLRELTLPRRQLAWLAAGDLRRSVWRILWDSWHQIEKFRACWNLPPFERPRIRSRALWIDNTAEQKRLAGRANLLLIAGIQKIKSGDLEEGICDIETAAAQVYNMLENAEGRRFSIDPLYMKTDGYGRPIVFPAVFGIDPARN